MARLKWDDVQAPNFSASVEARNAASQAFDRAFAGVNRGLDRWEGERRDDALGRVFAAQAEFANDPEAYRRAVAAGEIDGLDSTYLKAADRRDVLNFQDTLATRRNREFEHNVGQQTFQRTRADWDRQDERRDVDKKLAGHMQGIWEASKLDDGGKAAEARLAAALADVPGATMDDVSRLMGVTKDGIGMFRDGVRFVQGNESHQNNMRDSNRNHDQSTLTFTQQQEQLARQESINNIKGQMDAYLAGVENPDATMKYEALRHVIGGGGYGKNAVQAIAAAYGIYMPDDVEYVNDDYTTNHGTQGTNAGTGGNSNSGAGSVGFRNNNYGNVRDIGQFVNHPDYLGKDANGFARFKAGSPMAYKASEDQLRLYMNGRSRNVPSGGIQTIDQIVNTWAPKGRENSPESVRNYVSYVSQRLGVGASERLTESDIPRLARAMGEFETGARGSGIIPKSYTNEGASLGMNVGSGQLAGTDGVTPVHPVNGRPITQDQRFDPTSANFSSDIDRLIEKSAAALANVGNNTYGGSRLNYTAAQSDRRDVGVVVAEAVGENGALAGANRGDVTTAVRSLIRDSATQGRQLSAAAAVSLLAAGTTNVNSGMFGSETFALGNKNLGGSVGRVNYSAAVTEGRALLQNGQNLSSDTREVQRAMEGLTVIQGQMTTLRTQLSQSHEADMRSVGGQKSQRTINLERRLSSLALTADEYSSKLDQFQQSVSASTTNENSRNVNTGRSSNYGFAPGTRGSETQGPRSAQTTQLNAGVVSAAQLKGDYGRPDTQQTTAAWSRYLQTTGQGAQLARDIADGKVDREVARRFFNEFYEGNNNNLNFRLRFNERGQLLRAQSGRISPVR